VLSQSTHPCLSAANPVCVCVCVCACMYVCVRALQVAGRPASSYEYYRTFSTKVQINGWKVSTINISLCVCVCVCGGGGYLLFLFCVFYFLLCTVHFAFNVFVLGRQYACLCCARFCSPCDELKGHTMKMKEVKYCVKDS